MARLILNGKKAGLGTVRQAIASVRDTGHAPDVRVTFEGGDAGRFIAEAVRDGETRVVIGGGDGSVQEAVDAIGRLAPDARPELGIFPLGTANDFATANGVPTDLAAALTLALTGEAVPVDLISANGRFFANMATAGFGAKVTAETPVELKNFLGGGAYVLSGVVKAIGFVPYTSVLRAANWDFEGRVIVGAIGNGRQAGGGQQLAPDALLDDGLMDVVLVTEFPAEAAAQVISELTQAGRDGDYVKRFRTTWLEGQSPEGIPVNLDGEPMIATGVARFEICPKAVRMILPSDSPLLTKNRRVPANPL